MGSWVGGLLLVAIAAGVGIGIWQATTISDLATEWTAIGAILAGGALLVAAVGLPVALIQLFTVERDVRG